MSDVNRDRVEMSSIRSAARIGPRAAVAMVVAALGGCSDGEWREWQPDDSGLRAQTPCRPSTYARNVLLAGATRRMTMHTCRVDGHLYAITWLDVATPADVDTSLEALTEAARHNVSAGDARAVAFAVAGSTPRTTAGRWAWSGQSPDGRPVQQQAAAFSRGLRVYQATMTGVSVDASIADRFFEALKWLP